MKKLIKKNIIKNKNKLFERNDEFFIGKPFYMDYDSAKILVGDSQKHNIGGLEKGSFLLAYYDNKPSKKIAILLRTIGPVAAPQDNDIIASIIEYYKENTFESSDNEKMDPITKYDFSFNGVKCNILGTFYEDEAGKIVFGSDIDNYYSPVNYSVYKPKGEVLELIVNFGLLENIESDNEFMKIGCVKYSSTSTFPSLESKVLVPTSDLIGKRTALFGKTRTGKSNTIKKIIQMVDNVSSAENPIGQIVFDINGEYANSNQQDEGTSIFEILGDNVERYSVYEKDGFKVLKTNFYLDVEEGFQILKSQFTNENQPDYLAHFLAIDLNEPHIEDFDNLRDYHAKKIRYERLKSAYLCCLYKAGFDIPNASFKLSFKSNSFIDQNIINGSIPKDGLTLEEASCWFEKLWDLYYRNDYFSDYIANNGHEWADEDLKAVLTMLSGQKQSIIGDSVRRSSVSGYIKLTKFKNLHTTSEINFKTDIIKSLRNGKIVLVDLSQGDEEIQLFYSDQLCKCVFNNAINNFIKNSKNNFIQFYFEEAHNLFPKKDTKDLTQIYNRIAKEGAKLHLGLVYATQEVSSISGNILKNTENWFISHLNNAEELNEIKKFDDFEDVADSLRGFSQKDKGFVRMKLISSPYVIPVQIDKFVKEGDN